MVHIYPPNPALAPYVECFNVLSGFFESEVQHLISARGVPMLMFPYQHPATTRFKHGDTGAETKPVIAEPLLLTSSNVYGQSTFSGAVNFVMVLLKPTGAYHFLQNSVQGMANTVYTLESTGVRGKFDELQDHLWSVQQPTEAVHWIQVYLTKYFDQKARVGVGDFSPVMHHMLRFPAALTVGDLARKFKCSERWIEKQCAIQTGLPPKSWLRLIRYRAAANYWLRHPEVPWMGIVAKFNYTDQSHLIRDFRAFAGNPPVAHFVQYGRTETMLKQDEAGLSGLLHKAN